MFQRSLNLMIMYRKVCGYLWMLLCGSAGVYWLLKQSFVFRAGIERGGVYAVYHVLDAMAFMAFVFWVMTFGKAPSRERQSKVDK